MNRNDTQFLRAFAIILVLNSHFDKYYPIPYLGTGGAIGNSIFFFLSAYGLYLSQQKSFKNFKDWFAHRIEKIYPSLWVALILIVMPIMIMQEKMSSSIVIDYIGSFFNPPYWFLQALLIYYLLAYPLINNFKKISIWKIWIILSLIYSAFYIFTMNLSKWSIESLPFVLIHYFMIFLFGIHIAKKQPVIYSGISNYICLLFLIAFFYVHKYLMMKGLFLHYQFLQQLVMYPIVYYFMKISRSPLINKIMQDQVKSRIINFIAKHTMEIYIVHTAISNIIIKQKIFFPLNVIIFLILTLSLSAIVNYFADKLRMNIANVKEYST